MAINANQNIHTFSLRHDLIQAYLSIPTAQVDWSFGTKKHLDTTGLDRDHDAEVTHIEKHWRSVAQTHPPVRAFLNSRRRKTTWACLPTKDTSWH